MPDMFLGWGDTPPKKKPNKIKSYIEDLQSPSSDHILQINN